MTPQEFTKLTKIPIDQNRLWSILEDYNRSSMTKEEYCKAWKKGMLPAFIESLYNEITSLKHERDIFKGELDKAANRNKALEDLVKEKTMQFEILYEQTKSEIDEATEEKYMKIAAENVRLRSENQALQQQINQIRNKAIKVSEELMTTINTQVNTL